MTETMTNARKTKSATPLIAASRFELPLLGSNQDSPDPESGVLPVTPRGTVYGAEGARTPGLLGAIQALSQLSYSPEGAESKPVALWLQPYGCSA